MGRDPASSEPAWVGSGLRHIQYCNPPLSFLALESRVSRNRLGLRLGPQQFSQSCLEFMNSLG